MVDTCYNLGWDITLVAQVAKLNKNVFEKCKKIISFKEAENLQLDKFTAVVLMSHDYDKDKVLFPIFYKQNTFYLGMLGPYKRKKRMMEELNMPECIDDPNIHSPIGLNIGAETPEEIALSIISEIIAVDRKRTGESLNSFTTSIH